MKELLTCCRTSQELEAMEADLAKGDRRAAFRIQSNLVAEKTGFRCTTCGNFYPRLEVRYQGVPADLKAISKPLGKRMKYKKACDVFRGDHYYATNKKTLLRFAVDGQNSITDETPIPGNVQSVQVSPDGRYIATETFSGTVTVIDRETKQTIFKRRNMDISGGLHFASNDVLVYFWKDRGIFSWELHQNRETQLWEIPAYLREMADKKDELPMVCGEVLDTGAGRLVFRVGIGKYRFAVELQDLVPVMVVPLADNWALPMLVYIPELERFTFPAGDEVVVYDRDFRIVETFDYPVLTKRLDGGGIFAIEEFIGSPPYRAILSPDGSWVLFDFFHQILLLDRAAGKLRFCVYSDTGGPSTGMGFVDNEHIWYNWGSSTYIMEIAHEQEKA